VIHCYRLLVFQRFMIAYHQGARNREQGFHAGGWYKNGHSSLAVNLTECWIEGTATINRWQVALEYLLCDILDETRQDNFALERSENLHFQSGRSFRCPRLGRT